MCDIQRIKRLKNQAIVQSQRIMSEDPLKLFHSRHVTDSGLTVSDLSERLDRISSCASIIELKESWDKSSDGVMEQAFSVASANYCKQAAICPICADRSQARRQARFADPIREQARMVADTKGRIGSGEYRHGDTRNRFAYLITYTIDDGDDLGDRLERLKGAKRSFRLMGQCRSRSRSKGESGKIAAAISTIEIKRGARSKEWHVHAHQLAFTTEQLDYQVYDKRTRGELCKLYGRNIPKEVLKKAALKTAAFRGENVPISKIAGEWLAATGGESIGIRVDPIQHVPQSMSEKKKRKYQLMSYEESVLRQSREVLKYCTKPLENSPGDAIEIIDKTFNRRLIMTYGQFRGIAGDDYDDPPEKDEQPFVLIWDTDTYGDPQPGRLREALEEEEGKKARSQCGILTGEYRRRRRSLVADRSHIGGDLAIALDDAKAHYRSRIRAVWCLYRQAVDAIKRQLEGCDIYSGVSPTLALDGVWIPGTDRRSIYAAAFA